MAVSHKKLTKNINTYVPRLKQWPLLDTIRIITPCLSFDILIILWNHLTIFEDCWFFAYSRGCNFMDASVLSFSKKDIFFLICFCWGCTCKFVGEGYTQATPIFNDSTVISKTLQWTLKPCYQCWKNTFNLCSNNLFFTSNQVTSIWLYENAYSTKIKNSKLDRWLKRPWLVWATIF